MDKKSTKIKKEKVSSKKKKTLIDEDTLRHNGWWKVTSIDDIAGAIVIEFGERSYLKALDNGLFTLGMSHRNDESPSPEEIFTAFQINDRKVSFKSGYGMYIGIDGDGVVSGRSRAVSSMEQWEPVFENGSMALLSELGFFMSINPRNNACQAIRQNVTADEICNIRLNTDRQIEVKKQERSMHEKGDLTVLEKSYVKKFQKFQDKKIRINDGNILELEMARIKGNLHEALLNRRAKMKADRYCK